jgi:hypothetical protein
VRIERVRAIAFGRLEDDELPLAPCMTVVHGANEAGKSTWHDALFAGLCGRRRGKGGRTRSDRDFEERRRPWTRDEWRVGVELSLADGRRIALNHDLDGMVDCSATDLALGRDVSSEIPRDGAPDGAVWLGLDRQTFPATACVRQADVLSVLENPDRLQEHLQRAASHAGRDQTAAVAIERIDAYLREHVGVDRAGARRPLRLALEAVDEAERRRARATTDHESFLKLAAEAEAAAAAGDRVAMRLRALRAARAEQVAEEARERLEGARAIAKRFPDGRPPAPVADDALAHRVSSALTAWERRPELRPLEGPSAEELRQALEALPEVPTGDREAHEDVTAAARRLHEARTASDLHGANRPPEPEPDEGKVGVDEIRELAHELAQESPELDPALEERVYELRRSLGRSERRRRLAIAGGAVLAVAGFGAVFFGATAVGLSMAAWGLAVLLWFVLRRDDGLQPGLRSTLLDAERTLAAEQHGVFVAHERRERARERAELLGLEGSPEALHARADEIVAFAAESERLVEWHARQADLTGRRTAAEDALAEALRSRGTSIDGSLDAAHRGYLSSCQKNEEDLREAGRREGLESQLAARKASEQALEEAEQAVESARAGLAACARECAVQGDGEESLVRGLSQWMERRREALAEHDVAVREYAELDAILRGGSLEGLEHEVARAERYAEELVAKLGDGAPEIALDKDAEKQLAQLEDEEREASREAQRLHGQVEERAAALASVPEAEEVLAAAREELERVRALQRTLELTRDHLCSAQDRVYRSIAPVLAETLRAWLPKVTGSRYRDATLDPASLEVQVCEADGAWRPAARLSHGTAEQIYLLLRMALASHLTLPGEPCPLVLDDVTVQADTTRTGALLDLLHAMSRERQVVLFTQEDDVLSWAENHLDAPQDRLVRLSPPPVG